MTTDSHLHDYRFHVSGLQIPALMTTDSMLRATDSMRYPQAGASAGWKGQVRATTKQPICEAQSCTFVVGFGFQHL